MVGPRMSRDCTDIASNSATESRNVELRFLYDKLIWNRHMITLLGVLGIACCLELVLILLT